MHYALHARLFMVACLHIDLQRINIRHLESGGVCLSAAGRADRQPDNVRAVGVEGLKWPLQERGEARPQAFNISWSQWAGSGSARLAPCSAFDVPGNGYRRRWPSLIYFPRREDQPLVISVRCGPCGGTKGRVE
jgi:hypothetical protein